MTETEATRKLCKRLRDRGWIAETLSGGVRYQSNGLPDRLVVTPDGAVLLEFKAHGGKLSAGQKLMLRKLRRVDPASAFVARFSADWSVLTFEDENGTALTVCDPMQPDDVRRGLEIARRAAN